MQKATLVFLTRGHPPQDVLLGFKQAGFGVGKYTGFGGKVETDETVERAALRELEEETGVKALPEELRPMGSLTFLFPAKPAWSQIVYVFLADRWAGDPVESGEMRPVWCGVDELPFEQMWQDAPHWLPHVLAGERIVARFMFGEDNESIEEVEVRGWDRDSESV
jgi:8-oxo-dGTP pyrophosphatase MutT (NUDIX family)